MKIDHSTTPGRSESSWRSPHFQRSLVTSTKNVIWKLRHTFRGLNCLNTKNLCLNRSILWRLLLLVFLQIPRAASKSPLRQPKTSSVMLNTDLWPKNTRMSVSTWLEKIRNLFQLQFPTFRMAHCLSDRRPFQGQDYCKSPERWNSSALRCEVSTRRPRPCNSIQECVLDCTQGLTARRHRRYSWTCTLPAIARPRAIAWTCASQCRCPSYFVLYARSRSEQYPALFDKELLCCDRCCCMRAYDARNKREVSHRAFPKILNKVINAIPSSMNYGKDSITQATRAAKVEHRGLTGYEGPTRQYDASQS